MSNNIIPAPLFKSAVWWLSDNRFTWIDNSFQYSENIDIHSDPRAISLSKKLVKDSWTVITEKINCIILIAWDIMAFWNSWGVYRRNAWTWTKNSTNLWVPILSAIEFNSYLYWTTSTVLYRVAIGSISNTMTLSSLNYQTLTSSSYHPLNVFSNDRLLIWNKNTINYVDVNDVYQASILTISPQLEIKYIYAFWSSVKIFAKYTNNNASQVLFWDWLTVDISEQIPLNWVNIEQVIIKDWVDYIISNNKLWVLDWYKTATLKDITSASYSTNLNSITIKWNRLLYWWVWWVYEWGGLNKNYAEVLSFSYRTSNALTDVIWAIFFDWTDLYVAWSNGSTYWIDKLSTTVYNTTWYLTTRVYYWNSRLYKKASEKLLCAFNALTWTDTINIYYRYNLSSTWVLFQTITATSTKVVLSDFLTELQLTWTWVFIELKIELNSWTGTTTPEFYEMDLLYNMAK